MMTTGSLTAMASGVRSVVCAISNSVSPLSASARVTMLPDFRALDLRISRGYVSGTPTPSRNAASAIISVMN